MHDISEDARCIYACVMSERLLYSVLSWILDSFKRAVCHGKLHSYSVLMWVLSLEVSNANPELENVLSVCIRN